MARSDLVKLAEKELRPYGIGPRDLSTKAIGMEAYELIWTHNGQSHRIHLPRDANNKREVAIFRSNLEKQLREFEVKLLDPGANRVDIEEQLEEIRSELSTSRERYSSIEEMFFEWVTEAEKKLSAFTEDLAARLANQDTLIAAALQKRSTPIQQAPQAIAPQPAPSNPPQRVVAEPEPKKGLDALDEVRKQKWAEITAEMDREFDLDEFDLRILFFLHKVGAPQTAHTLREAGVWKAMSSIEVYLEGMANPGLVVRTAAKEWGITKKGISALQDAFNEDEPDETLDEEGLTEALAFARGEPNHAKATKVHVSAKPAAASTAITPKPTFTVVPPSGPRILRPIEATPNVKDMKLTYVEKAILVLAKKEMTIEELQRAIGHSSGQKSLANMLYKCEREDSYAFFGMIQYFYEQGKVYRITDKGRAYIQRIAPVVGQILAAS